jgi:hypothetical protein
MWWQREWRATRAEKHGPIKGMAGAVVLQPARVMRGQDKDERPTRHKSSRRAD